MIYNFPNRIGKLYRDYVNYYDYEVIFILDGVFNWIDNKPIYYSFIHYDELYLYIKCEDILVYKYSYYLDFARILKDGYTIKDIENVLTTIEIDDLY